MEEKPIRLHGRENTNFLWLTTPTRGFLAKQKNSCEKISLFADRKASAQPSALPAQQSVGSVGQTQPWAWLAQQGGPTREPGGRSATWRDGKEQSKCNYWPCVPGLHLNRHSTKVPLSGLKFLNF